MSELASPARNHRSVKALLGSLGVAPRKWRGQSFLVSPRAAARIVQAARLTREDAVLEIGPGLGALTEEILRWAGRLVAIECDARLSSWLRRRFGGADQFELIEKDALKIDLRELAQRMGEGRRTVKVVSTIPYSISGPLIGKLLEAREALALVVLTVQKELAGRITASPGGKDYGAFTIFCRYHADVKKVFTIPPSAFYPRPNVVSTVVVFTPRARPPVSVIDGEAFLSMVRLLFSHRRKAIRTALRRALRDPGGDEELAGIFSAARINPLSRAEQLGMEELASLCNNLCAVERFHRELKFYLKGGSHHEEHEDKVG